MLAKINCVFHPQQTLTNFCINKNCLLPLCPTCIKIHTSEHISLKVNPKYQNINDLMSQVLSDIKYCSQIFVTNLNNLNELQSNRRRHKQFLSQRLEAAKMEIICIIQAHFKDLQITLSKSLQGENLNISNQINKLRQSMNVHIENFKSLEDSLYSQKAMRTVIKFKGQNIKQKTIFANKITQQFLQKCQNQLLLFGIQNNYQTALSNLLKKIITFKSVQNLDTQIQILPPGITETLNAITEDCHYNLSTHVTSKAQSKNIKNSVLQSIPIDSNNRSRRSGSEKKCLTKVRPGLHLIHLDHPSEGNIKNHQRKILFNKICETKYERQNTESQFS